MKRQTLFALSLTMAIFHPELHAADPGKAEEKAISALKQAVGSDVSWAEGPGSSVVGLKITAQRFDEATLAHLQAFKHLRRLKIECEGNLSEPGLAVLAQLPELENLNLAMVDVTDAMLGRLKKLNGLRKLFLYGKEIGNDGLANLKKLKRLEVLAIFHSKIGDSGLAHLAGLVELRELYLAGSKVSDKGLNHLCRLTKLRRLNLQRTEVAGPGLVNLAAMDELTEVDLARTPLDEDALKYMPAAKRLRWLCVSDSDLRLHGRTACPGGKVKLHVVGMTAELRDAASGKALAPLLRHLAPNEDGAKIVCWAFSPDGKLLATAAGYKNNRGDGESMGEIRVWEVSTGKQLDKRHRGLGYVRGLEFLKDSKTLVFVAERFLVDGP